MLVISDLLLGAPETGVMTSTSAGTRDHAATVSPSEARGRSPELRVPKADKQKSILTQASKIEGSRLLVSSKRGRKRVREREFSVRLAKICFNSSIKNLKAHAFPFLLRERERE